MAVGAFPTGRLRLGSTAAFHLWLDAEKRALSLAVELVGLASFEACYARRLLVFEVSFAGRSGTASLELHAGLRAGTSIARVKLGMMTIVEVRLWVCTEAISGTTPSSRDGPGPNNGLEKDIRRRRWTALKSKLSSTSSSQQSASLTQTIQQFIFSVEPTSTINHNNIPSISKYISHKTVTTQFTPPLQI